MAQSLGKIMLTRVLMTISGSEIYDAVSLIVCSDIYTLGHKMGGCLHPYGVNHGKSFMLVRKIVVLSTFSNFMSAALSTASIFFIT